MATVEPASVRNDAPTAARARLTVADVTPVPTDEEAAAIAAALEVLWPRAIVDEGVSRRPSAWKFSGRWWTQPIPLRRARPWT